MNDDILYRLLPAIYRQRDLQQGRALQTFMRVLESQYALLQQDIRALNDNWFIETCDDWVVPYIADLLHIDYVKGQRQTLPSHRTLVANTVAHRRAKGTVQTLAQAAQEVSGWRVAASLGADALALTQSMQFVRPQRVACADLRSLTRGATVATAAAPRSVEVRVPRAGAENQAGRYHLQGIALYMCRLSSYPMLQVQPCRRGEGRYTFHPMGVDMPLFNPPYSHELGGLPRSPDELPVPLERARLREDLRRADDSGAPPFSIALAWPDQPRLTRDCAAQDMAVADLSDWHAAGDALVTVDPVLGRLVIGPARTPAQMPIPVRVSCHYGFSGDLGGGPYPRATEASDAIGPDAPADPSWNGRLEHAAVPGSGSYACLASALRDWRASGKDGVLHIADNSTYRWGAAQLTRLELGESARLRIVALSGASPCIEGDLAVSTSGQHGMLELNGLWCHGHLTLSGAPTLVLRHCTLLPSAQPSVHAHGADLQLTLEHCITGALELQAATLRLAVSDSIVDGGAHGGTAPAITGGPGVQLTLQRCTVLGDVAGDVASIADSLITGSVSAARPAGRQIRYSYAATVSGAPHSYRNQPDPGGADARRVEPAFTSRRFGAPGYCQLSSRCSEEIRKGAGNGSEMGAFHLLSQHLRQQYLERVIAEYLPYSMHAGVFFLT